MGLNYQVTLYNLLDHSDIDDASVVYSSMMTDAEFNATIQDVQQQTTDLQLALIDLYESTISQE